MKPQPEILRVTRSREADRAAYDRLSGWYDILSAGGEKKFLELGLCELAAREGEKILEIGFGTGRGVLTLAKGVGDSGKVCGMDLSKGMLERARRRIKAAGLMGRVDLRCGDAVDLPYEAGSFDAVFMSFTLELFDTPEIPLVLERCRRVLRPGGRMCVVAMSKPPGPPLAVRIYEWVHEKFPAFADCRPIHVREAMEEARFRVREVHHGSMFGLPVEVVLAEKA